MNAQSMAIRISSCAEGDERHRYLAHFFEAFDPLTAHRALTTNGLAAAELAGHKA